MQISAERLMNIQMRGNKDELQDSVDKACEILANKDKYVTASLKDLRQSTQRQPQC